MVNLVERAPLEIQVLTLSFTAGEAEAIRRASAEGQLHELERLLRTARCHVFESLEGLASW